MSTLKTGKVKTTTIADELDTESTAVTNVINGSAKAWVNFNGTGTVAIRQAFNVSSITDDGTGRYTINFSTAMPDTNYCVQYTTQYLSGVSWLDFQGVGNVTNNSVSVANYEGAYYDIFGGHVAIFR